MNDYPPPHAPPQGYAPPPGPAQPSYQWQPKPEDKPLSIPSWVGGAIIAFVSIVGLGGTGGGLLVGGAATYTITQRDENPAVLATEMAALKLEMKETKNLGSEMATLQSQMKDTTEQVRELSADLKAAAGDRWTRTDHNDWVRDSFEPVRIALDSHEDLQGHTTGMRVINDMQQAQVALEARVRALENQRFQ